MVFLCVYTVAVAMCAFMLFEARLGCGATVHSGDFRSIRKIDKWKSLVIDIGGRCKARHFQIFILLSIKNADI